MAKNSIWSDETQLKMDAAGGITDTIRVGLQQAILKRHKAKDMADEAKALNKEANGVLQPLLEATDIDKIEMLGVGAVSIETSQKKAAVDLEEFERRLLEKGIEAAIIKEAHEYATGKLPKSSVKVVFRAAKV